MLCSYCNKLIPKNIEVYHENTAFTPDRIYFCSQECKKKWKKEAQEYRRHFSVWSIGSILGRSFFIKENILLEEHLKHYVNKFRFSFFSTDMTVLSEDLLQEETSSKETEEAAI